MAIYKSLGFTSSKLRRSFALRFLLVSFLGGVLGMLLSVLFADKIILMLVKNFGIGEFISNITFISTIAPIIILSIIFGIFAYLASKRIKKFKIIDLINE